MIDNLMSDVLTLYHDAIEQEGASANTEQCYEKAFSTLLMKQQHLLAALNHDNKLKADSMIDLQEKLDSNFREQSRHHSPEAAQLRARSSDDEISYNQNALYRSKDPNRNPSNKPTTSHVRSPRITPPSLYVTLNISSQRIKRKTTTSPPSKLVFKKTSPRGTAATRFSNSPDENESRFEKS